ncbi:hypothetical protein BDQ17DRAFT_1357095 [Cyathus striatus]|nr:hypothetical protein BDQ17DRAFT_1357095 [Cyathus striatus]
MPSPILPKKLYSIQATPYGGRGAFASTSVEQDTHILACAGPYASVILRKFRKEACAWCFSYAFESGKNSWNVRVDGAGAWFCKEDCKGEWLVDEQHSGIRVAVNTALDKTLRRKKQKGQENEDSEVPPQLGFLDTLISEGATSEIIEKAWTLAEQVYAKVGPEETSTDAAALNGAQSYPPRVSTGTWTDMLNLQLNEETLIHKQPAMLTTHIRVYGFLRQVIANLPLYMTSAAVRALLGRDHGNVFGIWDNGAEENEMLGWGMYVFGSYFNHDCSPNLVKTRSGRAMNFTTTGPVSHGQELCISYVDVGENTTASERCHELRKEWFLSCLCSRCKGELEANA